MSRRKEADWYFRRGSWDSGVETTRDKRGKTIMKEHCRLANNTQIRKIPNIASRNEIMVNKYK